MYLVRINQQNNKNQESNKLRETSKITWDQSTYAWSELVTLGLSLFTLNSFGPPHIALLAKWRNNQVCESILCPRFKVPRSCINDLGDCHFKWSTPVIPYINADHQAWTKWRHSWKKRKLTLQVVVTQKILSLSALLRPSSISI